MGALYEGDNILKDPNYGTNITKLVKTDTPFTDMLGMAEKEMTRSTYTWEVEGFDTQDEMAVVEGVAKTSGWGSYVGSELSMYGEIMRSKGYQLTRQAQATKTATISKGQALARQIKKDVERWKLGFERIALSYQDEQAQALAATPRLMRGALRWLRGTDGAVLSIPSAFRTASSSVYTSAIASLSESALVAMVKAAYDQVHTPLSYTGFVGSDVMTQILDMKYVVPYSATPTQALVNVNEDNNGTLRRKVEFMEFAFGSAKVLLSPNLAWTPSTGAVSAYTPKSAIFIVPSMWAKAFLIPFGVTQQVENGDGPHGFHEADGLILCKNPQGQLLVYTNS